MHLTLRSKIFILFLVVSLCGILLTSFSILWGFEDHFKDYLTQKRDKNISLIVEEAKQEYQATGNLVSEQMSGLLHEQAMTENLFYKIYNADGELLADSTMMLGMMDGMGMQSEFKSGTDNYLSTNEDLLLNQKIIGRLSVYYSKHLLEEDLSFLNTVKQNIYIGAFITIILSILFSVMFSKQLTSGLDKLSKAVQALQAHKWHTRVEVERLSKEMQPLALSFNNLANTLSKEESLRKQFTADLAHELRTPLATLRSQIEAYQDGILEPTTKRLQQSHDELMRLVRLVNELEKLLKAENPQIKLQMTDIEAIKMAAYLESQFKTVFQEKGVELVVKKNYPPIWFKGDRDRVIQILTNLINNAHQYTPSNKKVELDILESENFIGFSIKDEGTGIRQEDIPFLFERFYRGDKSRDRKTGGLGIGLSIVKALVDAHHGEIVIESRLDLGTKVIVYFPKK